VRVHHHDDHVVPEEEIRQRIGALQRAMRDEALELTWIDHLADRLYFSGSAQDGVLLVPVEGTPVFYVRKSVARAERESPLEIRPYPGRRQLLVELQAKTRSGGQLGLALDVTRAVTYAWLQEGLDEVTLVDTSWTVRRLRAVKSSWEIEQVRRACHQAATMFREIVDEIAPGMTELELTGRVEGRLRRLGHGGTIRVRQPASDIALGVVVAGDSGQYPTSFNGPVGAAGPYPPTASGAGWKRLARDETVMLDVVTSYNGYHGDNTRTFFVGDRVPDAAARAHDFCREILAEIERRMRPGAVCSEIYREVGELASRRGEPEGFMGHGENRVRFLGHGVGLELDELPVLAEKIDMQLEPGTILAVEPKAFLTGVGPVGIESTYVVNEDGCESLCPVDEGIVVAVGRGV
jgi:Xaa-Pro aminopeptidase